MERISVFNYEVFYLDFLEGNLSEEDTTLLLAFLEAHPEYKMEDDLLPTLKVDDIQMPLSKKENLKQPLFSNEINESNIEYFLIAQSERLLSGTEKEQLAFFLSKNPHYLEEQKQFKAVYLKADQSIIFTHKENLKKKKAFILWPYISIAASLILAFLIWNNSQNTRIDSPKTHLAKKGNEVAPILKKSSKKENKVLKSIVSEHNPTKISENTSIVEQKEAKKFTVDSLPVRPPKMNQSDYTPVLISYKEQKLKPVTPVVVFNENDKIVTSTAMSEENMVSPIEPITAYLEKKINTIIEYKKQERTEKQPKKLFIKVGQFEFYRKKH